MKLKPLPRVLILLTLAHGLVDAFASLIQPLWPDLQRTLKLGDGSIQGAYLAWGLATSVTQFGFAYWGDRDRGRWLLWAGPAAGVLCLSAIGLAGSLSALGLLLVIGGLGIAAFHPEAAALAGDTAPEERSRAMSVFAVGGYLGQAIGPIYSGVITTRFGLEGLVWSLAWGLPCLLLLALSLVRSPALAAAAVARARPDLGLASNVRGRAGSMGLLVAIGVCRVLPALGVPLALSYLLKQRGDSNQVIGLVQSTFLAGVGGGSLGCAVFVRRGIERRVLVRLPIVVVPLVAACPFAHGAALAACVALAGLLLGATMPILVSYGQRLMPEGQRVASSLTMGVTWGAGGVAVAAIMAAAGRLQRPDLAFPVFATACAFSSVLCFWLPETSAGRPGLPGLRPAPSD